MSKATAPTNSGTQHSAIRRDELPLAGRQMELRDFQRAKGDGDAPLATAHLILSAGAAVRRYDWYRERWYLETLVCEEGAIRMGRLRRGAPLLNSHNSWDLDAVLGVLEAPSVRDGQLHADTKFSRRQEVAGIVQDVADGVVRNVSVGYVRHRVEMVAPANEGDLWTYRCVDWEPYEGSLVPIPADMDSQVQRSAGGELVHDGKAMRTFPCEFVEITPTTRAAAQPPKGTTMTEAERLAAEQAAREAAEAATRAAAEAAAKTARDEATKAERARVAEITSMCQRHKVSDMAPKLIDDGITVDAARAAVLERLAASDAASGGHRNVGDVRNVGSEVETRAAGIAQALMSRLDPKTKLDDNGRQFRGMSLLEMGRDWLEFRGVNTRGWSRMELATAIFNYRGAQPINFRWPGEDELAIRSPGMLSTSDFANLLANVANKRLRRGYDENVPSYRAWARRAPNAPDFKTMTVVQLGAAPDLLQTNEHGEFKYGAMTDGKETYSMLTYGRIVSLTRQALINDDLRGFDRLVGAFGNSAARLENRTVYAILTANANLADGGALFNATATTTAGGHANLGTGAGSALQQSSLVTARAAMRKQKGLQSEELNIAPRYLIVPADLEQTAYQLTSPDFVPATTGNINEFRRGGRTELVPVIESVLSGNSATAWYLAADNGAIDTVEYCYLDGAEGPVLESEMGFEVDGMSLKARLDFAAKAIDFRGLYKANGA